MAGRLVRLSQRSNLSYSKPVLSRSYAWLMLGRFHVELELMTSLRAVRVRLHVANATGLLNQAHYGAMVSAAALILAQQVVRAVREVVEAHFMCLKFETLAMLDETTATLLSLATLERLCQARAADLVVNGQTITSEQLRKKFASFLPVADQQGIYHSFFSYRCVDAASARSAAG